MLKKTPGELKKKKKEITEFWKKLSMTVNLLIEFNRKIYNLHYKSHTYKIKTMTLNSTNTHLKVPIYLQTL